MHVLPIASPHNSLPRSAAFVAPHITTSNCQAVCVDWIWNCQPPGRLQLCLFLWLCSFLTVSEDAPKIPIWWCHAGWESRKTWKEVPAVHSTSGRSPEGRPRVRVADQTRRPCGRGEARRLFKGLESVRLGVWKNRFFVACAKFLAFFTNAERHLTSLNPWTHEWKLYYTFVALCLGLAVHSLHIGWRCVILRNNVDRNQKW